MKSLLLGIAVILLVGIGGLVYRNAIEHPPQPVACPVNSFQCPDGTSVPHLANSCDFPACPPPNVSLSAPFSVVFALPEGYIPLATYNPNTDYPYVSYSTSATTSPDQTNQLIEIRQYPISASSTALATIQKNAVSGTSGLPVPVTAFSSATLGRLHFTVVAIERFEGVVDTAYYLSRNSDVLRFDAIDRNVERWTDSTLDTSQLPANAALRKLLSTLQGG